MIDLVEVLAAFLSRLGINRFAGNLSHLLGCCGGDFADLLRQRIINDYFTSAEIHVHGLGCPLARGASLHHRTRRRNDFSTGEYVRPVGLVGSRVELQPAAVIFGQAATIEKATIGHLPNSHDDGIAFDVDHVIVVVSRIEAFLIVEDAEYLSCSHALDPFVCDDDFNRSAPMNELDAFLVGFSLFPVPGRHFFFVFKAHRPDSLCAQTLCGTSGVHGHIAAADHQHVVADIDLSVEG